MKSIWGRWPISLGLLLLCRGLLAESPAPASLEETVRLAQSLDELVDQQPSAADQLIREGKRAKRSPLVVPLRTITPAAAGVLKMKERELRDVLKQKHEKLSRVVYARLLAAKSNVPWLEVLRERKDQDLFTLARQEGVPLQEIHDLLDNLYTELAFAALDAPL